MHRNLEIYIFFSEISMFDLKSFCFNFEFLIWNITHESILIFAHYNCALKFLLIYSRSRFSVVSCSVFTLDIPKMRPIPFVYLWTGAAAPLWDICPFVFFHMSDFSLSLSFFLPSYRGAGRYILGHGHRSCDYLPPPLIGTIYVRRGSRISHFALAVNGWLLRPCPNFRLICERIGVSF